MGELEDRISSVLNDPEQLARISAMAQSLMGGLDTGKTVEDENAAALEKTVSLEKIRYLLRGPLGAKSPRLAVLEALAPCLDDKRREKLGRAMRLARVLRLAQAGLLSAEDGHV